MEPSLIDKAASFNTVRVPGRWTNNAAPTADATIDEAFAARVDQNGIPELSKLRPPRDRDVFEAA